MLSACHCHSPYVVYLLYLPRHFHALAYTKIWKYDTSSHRPNLYPTSRRVPHSSKPCFCQKFTVRAFSAVTPAVAPIYVSRRCGFVWPGRSARLTDDDMESAFLRPCLFKHALQELLSDALSPEILVNVQGQLRRSRGHDKYLAKGVSLYAFSTHPSYAGRML